MGSQPLLYRPRKRTGGCFFQGLEVKPSILQKVHQGPLCFPLSGHLNAASNQNIVITQFSLERLFWASAKKYIRKHLLLAIPRPLLSPHPKLWPRWAQALLPTTSSGWGRARGWCQSCHQARWAGSPMSLPKCAAKGGTGACSRGCLHPEQWELESRDRLWVTFKRITLAPKLAREEQAF